MGKSAPPLVLVYSLAAAAAAVALLATLALTTSLIPLTFLLFFPAVIASAWFGGVRAGLVTTFISALLIEYFLFDPPLTFAFRSFGDNLRLAVFVGVAVLISGITPAGRSAGRALRELEVARRFRALLEAAPDCMVVTDRDGIITLVNSQTERLFGYRRDELLGQPVEVLLPAELREVHRQHRAVFAANPRTREMGSGLELVAVRRDGSKLPVEVSLSPLETEHGLQVIATLRDVSERRLVQERLRQQQAQLAEAQSIAGIGSWEWNIQADTVIWSDTLYRIYGFAHDRPAMSYLGFLELVHPEDRAFVDGVVRRAFEEGTGFQFEHRIVRPDGAVRLLYARGEVIRNAEGRVVRMVGIGQDITERRQAEDDRARLAHEAAARAAAEENQRRLTFLTDVSVALASSLDYEQSLRYLAEAAVPFLADWCAIHLLTDDGQVRLLTVVHRDPAKVELARILQHRYPVELDQPTGVAMVLRTGQTAFHPEITAAALDAAGRDPDHRRLLEEIGFRSAIIVPMAARGRTLGTISLLRAGAGPLYGRDDVLLAETLARRAALAVDNARLYREAEAQRRRLYAVLERLPVAVSIAEIPDGAFSFQNTASRHLAAVLCGADAVIDSLEASYRCCRYLHADGAPFSYEDLPAVRALRVGETADAVEIVCEGPAQRRTLLVSAVPLTDADGNVTASLAVSQDITERKTLEQQKDEFLSLAAHELKTPLTVVKGNSQLLQRLVARDRSSPEQLQQHLERIEQRVRYMEDLINELLDLSRVETGHLEFHPEPMDLAELLRSTVSQQQELHPEAPYRLANGDTPVLGVWDRGRIEQALTNLLDNAAKYSRPGSPIDIRANVRAGEVEVTVADRGIGIPASDLPHIFDRHYRARNVDRGHAGLGLGLYLTSQIVQRHGGRIWAESTEGAGATFHLLLPLQVEAPAAAS